MADPDLIACLYPHDDELEWAAEVIRDNNPSRYVGPPPSPRLKRSHNQKERQATGSPESFNHPAPHLELRFSHGPRTTKGFVLGRDPDTSDIVLVPEKGISGHHCAITFENDFKDTDKYRLVVRDLNSTCGTAVSYTGQGSRRHGGGRSGFRWIIGGHRVPRQNTIIIELHDHLKFRVVVPNHNIASQQYIGNVNLFRLGVTTMDNLFDQLGLPNRPPTEPASGARTPGSGDLEVRQKLGEGSFGVVTHVWNVSDGDEWAIKNPSAKAIRERRVHVEGWKKEAHIMGRVSHDHIVQFLGARFARSPELIFEFVPGGALGSCVDISVEEGTQILCQCLSAVAYLHGLSPPIVHRDIKPDNILVQYRLADAIHVKSADFGLSRESQDPTTMCGSWRYAAPEIWDEQDRRNARHKKRSYTLAVDIWSLGVTIVECVYRLPSRNVTGSSWCREIARSLRKDVQRNPDDLNQLLYGNMVVMEPGARGSAQECYDQAQLLSASDQARSSTPTPASYGQGHRQSASQYYQADAAQSTVLYQTVHQAPGPSTALGLGSESIDSAEIQGYIVAGGASGASGGLGPVSTTRQSPSSGSIDSTDIRRYIRSDAPPPGSYVTYNTAQGSFHETWLQDPLHPLGGGSAAGPSNLDGSNLSNWTTQIEGAERDFEHPEPPPGETRKRSTRQSKSSSSSGRQTKRRGHSFVAAGPSSFQHYEEAAGHEPTYQDGGYDVAVSAPIVPRTNNPSGYASQYHYHGYGGATAPDQNAYTDSEQAAAILLQAMRGGT